MVIVDDNVEPRITLRYCNVEMFGWNENLLRLIDDVNL